MDAMRRAMIAQGKVDPDEVIAQAATIKLDEPELVAEPELEPEVEQLPIEEQSYLWPVYRPTTEIIAAAIARQEHGDAVDPNGMENIAAREIRAEGFIAEELFAEWLKDEGARFERDGGPNAAPDFVVAGTSVGIRITAVKTSSLTPSSLIYLFERHAHGGATERFFVGSDRRTGLFHMLGGISRERFVQIARLHRSGEQVCRGFTAHHDLRATTVAALEAPSRWLTRLGCG